MYYQFVRILGWVELKKKKKKKEKKRGENAYSGPGPIHDEKFYAFGERV